MSANEFAANPGLEGVVVAETRLCRVDGHNGRLVIRGLDLEDAAARLTFEGMAALLFDGVSTGESGSALARQLGMARVEAFSQLGALGDALSSPDGMEALRAGLAHQLASSDPDEERVRIAGPCRSSLQPGPAATDWAARARVPPASGSPCAPTRASPRPRTTCAC